MPFAAEAASLAALVFHVLMILPAPGPAHPLCIRLALDLRSLALLRAGLGLLLLIDALCRLFYAGPLYTDAGLLPRDLAVAVIESGRWSLHLANGGLLFALLLSALQVLAAAALMVGWRARWTGPLLWMLVVSSLARHPAMVDATDALSLSLLSFGLLLPWNARWSVDAAFAQERLASPTHRSWAGIALLAYVCTLPIALVLWATGPAGLGGLLSSASAHAPGRWLLYGGSALPWIELALRIAAWLILPLAIVPLAKPYARNAAFGLCVLLCVVALLSVSPPALALLGLLAAGLLVDASLWDALCGKKQALPELRIHPDRDAPGALGLALLLREFLCLQHTQVSVAQDSPRAARLLVNGAVLVVIDRNEEAYLDATAIATLLRRSPPLRPLRRLLEIGFASALGALLMRLRGIVRCRDFGSSAVLDRTACARVVVVAVALLFLLTLLQLGAAGALPLPVTAATRVLLRPFGLDRSWLDRLPAADATRRWIAVPGERRDGAEVNAQSDTLSAPDYADLPRPWFAGERGRQYGIALSQPGAQMLRTAFARYLCNRHPQDLARVRVTLMVRNAGSGNAEQQVLLRYECRADAAP